MSFSEEVKEEILDLYPKKTCCRKAWAYGMLTSASIDGDHISVVSRSEKVIVALSEAASTLVKNAHVTEIFSVGEKAWRFEASSAKVSEFLQNLDSGRSVEEAVGMRCDACKLAYLRSFVISTAYFASPHKEYRAEFVLASSARAASIKRLLADMGIEPNVTVRRGKPVLYYRNSIRIEELLTICGCNGALFEMMNSKIEREIKNDENRATNCVAKNISRVVDSAQRQIEIITKLIKTGKIELLPEDLRKTAELRIENSDMSLAELASIHEPPISKSGLNHRLSKISKAAEEFFK